MGAIAAHLRYIAKAGRLPIEDDRGVVREGKDEARFELNGGCGISPNTQLIRELQDTDWVKSMRFITKTPANSDD